MIDRRDWLKLAGAVGGQLALGGLGCTSSTSAVPAFAAVFEPTHASVLVSVYLPFGGATTLVVEDAETGDILEETTFDQVDSQGLGVWEATGLAPNTAYQLRLGSDGPVYRFKTLPEPTSQTPMRFVFSADIDLDPLFHSNIFSVLAQSDADFFLCLGDWPYADNPPGAFTEAEFHEKHEEVRIAPQVQDILQAMAVYAIYDDHEVRNNWDGRFREEEKDRIEVGVNVWDAWFPLRDQNRRYRKQRLNAHAELFILDTRLYRSANEAPDDEQKTMLGKEQYQWLLDGLRKSDATFKLIATSVPLDFGFPEDSWAVFTNERNRLFTTIVDEKIQTCVFLTADQHFFSAHHFEVGLKEFQVGPIARGLFPELAPQQQEEIVRFNQWNYGEILLDSSPEPTCTIIGRDQEGAELYREVIQAGIGTLEIRAPIPRPFVCKGAHTFHGTTPTTFAYAPVGAYQVTWLDTNVAGPNGTLAADEVLRLEETV